MFSYTSKVFRSLFSRRMDSTSTIFLVASPDQIRQHKYERLGRAARQSTDASADDERWPLHIPPCARVHLQECVQISRQRRVGDLVNLMQNPSHMAPCRRLFAPTLLRGSLLWSLSRQRLACPVEYLLLQGIPASPAVAAAIAAAGAPAEAHVIQCPFVADVTERFGESAIRRMAGNAMHVQQVGATFLYAFALLAELRRLTD